MTTVEGRAVPPPGRLGPRSAFSLQASVVVFFLAGASAPTPLYATYQQEWHFSPITTTVVFGVYAVAILLALLVVGSLSDHVGRRPVIFGSIVVQTAAVVVFAAADGVPALLCARILQGLATGTVVGAVGAGMIDIRRSAGTLANAVTPAAGTAVGALGSGLLVTYAPQPTHLVYHILFGIYVLQAVGVVLMAETAARTPGALRSLRVTWSVPAQARGPLLRVAPVVLAVWALAGFYGSLGPALVRGVVTGQGALLGGLALFTLTASGALTVLVLRSAAPRTTMRIGTVALIAGVALTLLAIAIGSAGLFFTGTAVAGVGFGAGYQGGVRAVVPLAEPHERSGLLTPEGGVGPHDTIAAVAEILGAELDQHHGPGEQGDDGEGCGCGINLTKDGRPAEFARSDSRWYLSVLDSRDQPDGTVRPASSVDLNLTDPRAHPEHLAAELRTLL